MREHVYSARLSSFVRLVNSTIVLARTLSTCLISGCRDVVYGCPVDIGAPSADPIAILDDTKTLATALSTASGRLTSGRGCTSFTRPTVFTYYRHGIVLCSTHLLRCTGQLQELAICRLVHLPRHKHITLHIAVICDSSGAAAY